MTTASRTDTSAPRLDSFEAFVHSTGQRLMRTAVLLCADRDAAQDLLQATYAAVFARWRLVSRAEHPLAYTRTIMTRLLIGQKRRKRVVEVHVDVDPAAPTEPTATRLSLLSALATLPHLDRAEVTVSVGVEPLKSSGMQANCNGAERGVYTKVGAREVTITRQFSDKPDTHQISTELRSAVHNVRVNATLSVPRGETFPLTTEQVLSIATNEAWWSQELGVWAERGDKLTTFTWLPWLAETRVRPGE